MKNLLISIITTITFSVFASLENDINFLAKMADVGTNGGEAFVSKYDVNTFAYKPLVKELMNDIAGSDCKYTPLIGREVVLSNIGMTAIFQNDDRASILLDKIHANKDLVGAIGYTWDGEEGDTEYCSTELLKFYFSNGQVLVITYDSTT